MRQPQCRLETLVLQGCFAKLPDEQKYAKFEEVMDGVERCPSIRYGNFDTVLKHFSRLFSSSTHHAPHAPCGVLYFHLVPINPPTHPPMHTCMLCLVPMRIGC